MFLEQSVNNIRNKGWIEVITGSMFSGKTEELIRRINRAKIANQKIKVFKPSIDNRYSPDKIVTHNEQAVTSIIVNDAEEILKNKTDCEVIAIDEAQFFKNNLIEVCRKLANDGKRVIVAGLDMDYTGNPFDPVPQLMALAEYITKLHAVCTNCGDLAQFTYRKSKDKEKIVVGDKKEYKALCRKCYNKMYL